MSKVTFKVFLNQLRAYLEQDPNNYLFLKNGCYSSWSPKQLGSRIGDLSAEDTDKIRLEKEKEDEKRTAGNLDTELGALLKLRNSQLSKFVQLIAVLCYYTEQDDVDQDSTSLAWIIKYLEKHYNIESKGVHFLDIASMTYKKGTPHQTFYKQFRALFMDNLRMKGDMLEYKNNEELREDEKMTPTLESTIVLWALERIDPRLTLKVQKQYGHQMVGSKCLFTLQPTIFQNVPVMLQELDDGDRSNAHSLTSTEGTGQLNASWEGRGGGSRRGTRPS